MDALKHLYKKLSFGGLIYIDDYNGFNGCKNAVNEFREENGITDPLHFQNMPEAMNFHAPMIEAVWWRKTRKGSKRFA